MWPSFPPLWPPGQWCVHGTCRQAVETSAAPAQEVTNLPSLEQVCTKEVHADDDSPLEAAALSPEYCWRVLDPRSDHDSTALASAVPLWFRQESMDSLHPALLSSRAWNLLNASLRDLFVNAKTWEGPRCRRDYPAGSTVPIEGPGQ